MTNVLRDDIMTIYRQAVGAVRADHAVRSTLHVSSEHAIVVGEETVNLDDHGVYAIAIGKAAVGMIGAATEALGDLLTRGIAVTKAEQPIQHERVTILQGAHPVPDERSLAAGAAVLQFAAGVPDGAIVLVLISGGGSALVESLRGDVSLDRLRDLTQRLLRAGASIQELNAVRSRLSRIKAGGLLRALAHTRVHNLIVSDVLGDDLHAIASGPTVPPFGSDAESIMQKYQLDGDLPPPDPMIALDMPPATIVANLKISIEAAASAAEALGYRPVIESLPLTGEAKDVGRSMANRLIELAEDGRRICLLAGGETTVTVTGEGVGGRNTEAALAAAMRLAGVDDVALGFLATDGDDGVTRAAGAIVDGRTCDGRDEAEAARSLESNDSYTFLNRRGTVVVSGPTGTNVNDLVIGLVG